MTRLQVMDLRQPDRLERLSDALAGHLDFQGHIQDVRFLTENLALVASGSGQVSTVRLDRQQRTLALGDTQALHKGSVVQMAVMPPGSHGKLRFASIARDNRTVLVSEVEATTGKIQPLARWTSRPEQKDDLYGPSSVRWTPEGISLTEFDGGLHRLTLQETSGGAALRHESSLACELHRDLVPGMKDLPRDPEVSMLSCHEWLTPDRVLLGFLNTAVVVLDLQGGPKVRQAIVDPYVARLADIVKQGPFLITTGLDGFTVYRRSGQGGYQAIGSASLEADFLDVETEYTYFASHVPSGHSAYDYFLVSANGGYLELQAYDKGLRSTPKSADDLDMKSSVQ